MERDHLKKVYNAFSSSGNFVSARLIESGLINENYHITTDDGVEYVMQCIRPGLFPDVPAMIRNKELVSGHIRNKLIKQRNHDITRKYITWFHTYRQQPYYKDYEGNYWTLSLYIRGTRNYDPVPSPQIAYEIGTGFGEFVNRISDFDPSLLYDTLPFYQNIHKWQNHLTQALNEADESKKEKCQEVVNTLQSRHEEMLELQYLYEEELFPLRVTHNSFVANDLLLDSNNRPLCVLNLDLVMPGIIHYDFGDAVRSVCNMEGEYPQRLDKVGFDFALFEQFVTGFMGKAEELLTWKEKNTLHLGCKVMPYLQTIRYLIHYLEDNPTLRTKQPEECLFLAHAQLRLLHSILKQEKQIREFLKGF